jgi:class 3 adenylate cyclase
MNAFDPTRSIAPALNAPPATRRVREFYYRWEWDFQSSPEQLWPLASDTNRFNRDAAVPAIERRPAERLNNARRRLRMFRLGIPVEWEEEPFEWVRPYRFGVRRRYFAGPVAEMRVHTQLQPRSDGGTHMVYEVWATPRNLLGLAAIPVQIGVLSARAFAETMRRYDRYAVRGTPVIAQPARVHFSPGGQGRLTALAAQLLRQRTQPEIVSRLVDVIEHADEIALARMRPYALADVWGLPRRAVLEHFLLATRVGLLELEWDVLCPLCRNPKQVGATLSEIGQAVHCDVCNIDFSANFERSVELTFHPNPAIREAQAGEFCIAGPQITPHVVIQQLLQPGEERTLTPILEAGRYRLRALGLSGGQFCQVAPAGEREMDIRVRPDWPQDEVLLATAPTLRLSNATDAEQLVIVERMAWTDSAVTAAEVTALQTFRDLFASEALRPGEQIAVGSLAIVFTDLRGSTQLYNEIGDAPAFGLVMNHFDVLRAAINEEGGAIVKTIGDAVMAVFRRPAPAIRAMLRAQRDLAALGGDRALLLRAGIHYGACIAVTLNDRLDYFGSTVNQAARLEGLSTGSDIIVSETVAADPEVVEMLAQGDYQAEHFTRQLKGFDNDGFTLCRVTRAAQPSIPMP